LPAEGGGLASGRPRDGGSRAPFGFSWLAAISLRKLRLMRVGFVWISGGKGGRTGHKIVAAYGKGAYGTGLGRSAIA
jgi:hypothetical protein